MVPCTFMFDFTGGLKVGKGRREILMEKRGEENAESIFLGTQNRNIRLIIRLILKFCILS